MKPETIARWGRWLRWHTPVLARPFRRRAVNRLAENRHNPVAIPHLSAVLDSTDPKVAQAANEALRSLAGGGESTDALIDFVLEHAQSESSMRLVNECGYRHSIEGRWFLYLVLAGRFDDYLAADFEFQTLRAEFRSTPPELQTRLRESIVRAGDTRMNPLFVAEKKQTLLADLSDHDADLLVKVNARNQNWDALFKFLWVLPARHIRAAVDAMAQARWQPEDADRQALFHKLAGRVATAGETPKTITAPVLLNPVLHQWLARGEKEWAGEPEAKLRERLQDDVPPPDQIAALGALRARGRLTPQVLEQAGHSPQWLVRLVAAGLGGKAEPVNDGGKEWFTRLQTALDAESVWGLKPCHVTRDGLEALQEGLARLPDRRGAGGLHLLEAVVAHYTAHDIEIEVGARVVVGEDSFEIGG